MEKGKVYLLCVVTLLIGISLGVPLGSGTSYVVGVNHWTGNEDLGFIFPTNTTHNVSLNNNSLLWANLSSYAGNFITWDNDLMRFNGESGGGGGGSSVWYDDGSTLFTNVSGRHIQVNGTITGQTLTDGVFSVNGGAVTGATGDISMWSNDVGYITNYGDPWFNTSLAKDLQQAWMNNWNTSFGWGDHAGLYLTDWTDGDPHYNGSDAYGFTWEMADTWNASGGGNIFDQDLNSTDLVEFAGLNLTGFSGIINFTNGVAYDGATVNNLSNVDTTGGISKHDVLMWNGNAFVPTAEGTVFTFSIASFSDGETTTQLIGSGVWQADETMSFTASYNNGPPTTADVKMSINGGAYNDIGNMDAVPMTSGTNYDGDINYPASKDQYLRFRLDADDGEDSDIEYETSIYFRNYIWYGDTTQASGLTEAHVEALPKAELTNDNTQTWDSITIGVGEYIGFAYPSSYDPPLDYGDDYEDDGLTDFRVDGIACAMNQDSTTLSITNSAGYVENYDVYVSTTANLGTGVLYTHATSATINPLYYGKTTTASGYSEADVEGLATSEITNDNTQTWDSITTGVGEYMLFAFPKRLSASANLPYFKVGGFCGGFECPETVSVTNSNGWTEDYYVWRSTNSNLGAQSVETVSSGCPDPGC